MAKMKLNVDWKNLLLEKGEKIGFGACAAGLLALIGLGAYTAASSASTDEINKKFRSGVAEVEQKIQNGSAETPPIDQVVFGGAKTDRISFNQYSTPNSFFGKLENSQPRRVNPKILAPTEAVTEFVRGAISVYDIIKSDSGTIQVGVLQDKPRSANDSRRIRSIGKSKSFQGQPKAPGMAGQPGMGGMPGPGGAGQPGMGGMPGPGGAGQPGMAGMPGPGSMAGGGSRGGRGGGPGMPGGGEGGMMGALRGNEQEVQYVDLDSKQLDSARIAETILPKRMVVVTGTIPYRKQLEEYARALRYRGFNELPGNDLPLYKSFNVERQVLTPDGKEIPDVGWEKIDLTNALKELFVRISSFEPESYESDRTLAQLYLERIVPEDQHRLVIPRPKLMRGKYHSPSLPTVDAALKTLKDAGAVAAAPRNRVQNRLEEFDPFNRNTVQQPQGGPGGMMGEAGPPLGGGPRPGMGGGRPPAPMGNSGGASDAGPPGAFGGGRPPLGGAGDNQGGYQVPTVPEDAWLMRFIDTTIEPGYSYRYRVQLKAANPNFKRPVTELAYPGLADVEELLSDWFVIPGRVDVPRDENLYAAAGANDEKSLRSTERMSTNDEVYLQFQRWYDFIRLGDKMRPEPIGEWCVSDIKALRGQYIGETSRMKVPLWSMVNNAYVLREQRSTSPSKPGTPPSAAKRGDFNWPVDCTPNPQLLLVDFEGGRGNYVVNGKKTVPDSCETSVLMLTEDGRLQVYRSSVDVKDETRTQREMEWKRWVDEVDLATKMMKMGNQNNPAGGPGNGAGGSGGTPNG